MIVAQPTATAKGNTWVVAISRLGVPLLSFVLLGAIMLASPRESFERDHATQALHVQIGVMPLYLPLTVVSVGLGMFPPLILLSSSITESSLCTG
jgi:hypothetical protein